MAQGREFLLEISATGVTTSGMLTIPMQGDLTINPGKTIQVTKYKNGQTSAQQDAGWTASFEMGNVAPLSVAETRIWSLHDTGELCAFRVKNAVTGGIQFEGQARIAIQTMGAPTSGPASVSVQIGADGNVTRSVAA